MKIGIICEYNPFHNGHIYHLQQIKSLYPNCLIILILSGNITQRGDISIINKWDKTSIALDNGVDLVIELPFFFASQSADIFANGALKILNELKVDIICFGSELNNPDILIKAARTQLTNNYSNTLKKYVDKYSYPKACSLALKELCKININKPNDLLGLSYTREIIKNNYNIKIQTIKRTNDYHSLNLDNISSATSIRNAICKNIPINKYVPIESLNKINKNLNLDNYFDLLKYKIISTDNLTYIHMVDDNIEKRIKKGIYKSENIDELIKNIKTKKYSYNRIKRILIYILFDFRKSDYNSNTYIRILGFNKKGQNYLSNIKKNIKMPIITNYSNSNGLIDIDIKIDNILNLKLNNPMNREIKKIIIRK